MTHIVVEGERTRETLREGTRVWFRTLETGTVTPIFHDIHTDTEGYQWKVTYCGVSTVIEYVESGYDLRGTRMPLRHAVKIGRPCMRCWP